MQHEIDRAHRTNEPFVLAFVDVDGLKQNNDSRGHAAGDNMLRALGAELRATVRSYDPVVRVGGDEFLCAFSNMTPQAAADRVEAIKAVLRKGHETCSISVGLAELGPDDDMEDLTTRADAELYRIKNSA
jgi:diguanylate cyclase (GGDEF)-like protein